MVNICLLIKNIINVVIIYYRFCQNAKNVYIYVREGNICRKKVTFSWGKGNICRKKSLSFLKLFKKRTSLTCSKIKNLGSRHKSFGRNAFYQTHIICYFVILLLFSRLEEKQAKSPRARKKMYTSFLPLVGLVRIKKSNIVYTFIPVRKIIEYIIL